jgi:ankyrin repeat protein
MDTLPPEIFHEILLYLSIDDILILSITCKLFCNNIRSNGPLLDCIVRENDLDHHEIIKRKLFFLLKPYMIRYVDDYYFTTNEMKTLIQQKQIDTVKYIITHYPHNYLKVHSLCLCPMDRLEEFVTFLLQKDIKVGDRITDYLIRVGAYELAEKFIAQGLKPTCSTISYLAAIGNLEKLKYYHLMGVKILRGTIDHICGTDHLHVLQYLLDCGFKIESDGINLMCKTGKIDMFKAMQSSCIYSWAHALNTAVKYDHLELVKYIITQHAFSGLDYTIAIECAVSRHNYSILEYLLKISIVSHVSCTKAMELAASQDGTKVVELLLHRATVTAMCITNAVTNNNCPLVKLLREASSTEWDVWDNIRIAITNSNLEMVQLLFPSKVPANSSYYVYRAYDMPKLNLPMIQYLEERIQSDPGWIIVNCAQYGHTQQMINAMARWSIADTETNENTLNSALQKACIHGHIDIVKLIIDHKKALNSLHASALVPAIYSASSSGFMHIIKYFYELCPLVFDNKLVGMCAHGNHRHLLAFMYSIGFSADRILIVRLCDSGQNRLSIIKYIQSQHDKCHFEYQALVHCVEHSQISTFKYLFYQTCHREHDFDLRDVIERILYTAITHKNVHIEEIKAYVIKHAPTLADIFQDN